MSGFDLELIDRPEGQDGRRRRREFGGVGERREIKHVDQASNRGAGSDARGIARYNRYAHRCAREYRAHARSRQCSVAGNGERRSAH